MGYEQKAGAHDLQREQCKAFRSPDGEGCKRKAGKDEQNAEGANGDRRQVEHHGELAVAVSKLAPAINTSTRLQTMVVTSAGKDFQLRMRPAPQWP